MRLLLLYTLFGLLAAAARAQEVRQQVSPRAFSGGSHNRLQLHGVQTSDEGLVSATVPAISFFWQLGNSDVQQRGMQRCSRPLSLATDNPQSPAVTVPPLYLTLFPIGLQVSPCCPLHPRSRGEDDRFSNAHALVAPPLVIPGHPAALHPTRSRER